VAGTFRRAINDSHTRGGDALALSFIALSDPDQNDDSPGRLATRFLEDIPSVEDAYGVAVRRSLAIDHLDRRANWNSGERAQF
jgi:hypothetical protein